MNDDQPTVPYGYCHCGCGELAPIATRNDTARGYVKGQPKRFLFGHMPADRIEPPNPSGLCQCGCGEPTPIAPSNIARLGHAKGHPVRFVAGHNARPGKDENPNPSGLCACGCGQLTPLAKETKRSRYWIKGKHVPYCVGHGNRTKGAPPLGWIAEDRGYVTPCWIWQLQVDENGYGRARRGEHMVGAHRAVWTDFHGPVPDGLHLDHLCRVPSCVNPDHLEPVTPAENQRRRPVTKLTSADVTFIRASPLKTSVLARRFGVTASAILHARTGITWKDI